MTNFGAFLIMKLVKLIRFKSKHIEVHVSVVSIVCISYANTALLQLFNFRSSKWFPKDFTPQWILFYAKLIKTSMILANLMPYVGIIIKILIRRGCCCCKRKNYKPNTHNNPYFPLEIRYGSVINTVFVCFTFGMAYPALFYIGGIVLMI